MKTFWEKITPFLRRKRRKVIEIDPDEIMIDSRNLPQFDTTQLEGRLESPITKFTLYGIVGIFFLVMMVFLAQSWNLQVVKGQEYKDRSDRNMLRPVPVFAGRGVIIDRNNKPLAWNSPSFLKMQDSNLSSSTEPKLTSEDSVSIREYATSTGLAHVLGYVQYPSKDKNGFYYQNDFEGISGVEKYYNSTLQGKNGSRLIEVNARGDIISHNILRPADQGESVKLSIDSEVQSALYRNIKDIADKVGFAGGAGIIMNVNNGELLALTSYPEYSSQVMSDRTDTTSVKALLNNPNLPFLNRAVDGLYTPGSIVKPYVALGVLTEKIISPSTILHTTGSISIPNPYDSTKSTVFKDWKNNGSVDMRRALAVSSDAYFYIVGGGYKDQKGLGITGIDKYLKLFGMGSLMPESFAQGKAGTIPTPEWKKTTFNEDWYLGNTYHTAIGQYGFQVTPISMVRSMAAIANKGTLLVPTILKDSPIAIEREISDIPLVNYTVIHEGMRMGVVEGTGKALNVPYVNVATKTGTAELGVSKEKVNSWVIGFWPYETPKYAFVVMLEKGSVHNLIGAAAAMKQQLDWMNVHTPEYFK